MIGTRGGLIPIMRGSGENGVCLLGEAWGAVEATRGTPFQGPAGALLARLLAMIGLEVEAFLIANVCSFHPPGNRDPTLSEIAEWWPHTQNMLQQRPTIKVVVPLGNIALGTVQPGLTGIQARRGYVGWSDCLQKWTVPTVHPAFILRGNANWTPAWLSDVQKALTIAISGPPAAPRRALLLDPSPEGASAWVKAWEAAQCPPLAFDIETEGKTHDPDDTEIALGHQAAPIYRIGVAYCHQDVTESLSLPWGGAYTAVGLSLLQTADVLVVWNRHFDVPRLRAHGARFGLLVHDAQEMWHVLYPDLPKRLGFVASLLIPGQPYWKDQAKERPAFYNATDAAVTIELFERLYC